MHLPNGMLSDPVCLATGVAAAAAVGFAAERTLRSADRPNGLASARMAACVMALQMVNFAVDHGASAHLLGAAWAAIALGPSAAILVLGAVLAVQCVVLGDGGLTALGANALHMAVVAPLTAWLIYTPLTRRFQSPGAMMLAAGLAGGASVMTAAAACAGSLALSGAAAFGDVVSAMLGAHATAAGVEGLATALACRWLVAGAELPRRRAGWLVAGFLAIALLVPFASTLPDGLESVLTALNVAVASR